MHNLELKRSSLRRFDDLENEFDDSKFSRTSLKPLQSQVASFFKSKTKHSWPLGNVVQLNPNPK